MKRISQSTLTNTVITQRKALGLTQAQLSEATGINRSMLSHLESGEYMPSIPQAVCVQMNSTQLEEAMRLEEESVQLEEEESVQLEETESV